MGQKQARLIAFLLAWSLLLASCATPTPTPAPLFSREMLQATLDQRIGMTSRLLNPDVSGEVEFWHFWGSTVRHTAIRRIVDLCSEQLPNITITETYVPWGEIWSANAAAVAAGTGMPDVIVEDRPHLPQRARDHIVTNLQPYIERDHFDVSLFWPFTWNETLYDGDSYGIPFDTDVRVLFWNKNAFRDAGLDPEQPPRTWADLEAYADALDVRSRDGSYARIGFFPLWNAGPEFWARTNGWNEVVNGVPNYDDPRYIETLMWIKGWVDRYGGWESLQAFKAGYDAPPEDIFMAGAVPMVVDIAGALSQLNFHRPNTDRGEPMEWGVSFIPYKTQKANWSGGFALSIPYGSENPDAAWEVVKCISGPAGQVSWAQDTYSLPTSRYAAEDPLLLVDPYWSTIIDVLWDSQGSIYVPEYPAFSGEMSSRLEQVWRGELTPEEAAQQAQEAIDRVMAENTMGVDSSH